MRIRSSHSDSPNTVELILKWSKECSSSHLKCVKIPRPLPTRIIDIGSLPGDIPRLCSGESKPEPYCALSHCWGSSQPLRTTKATLHERESGIEPHLLPKTFQDAMVVTRRLSIRYLWIDSLCIIQDDELDWERESSRMASVYGSAYLVISATHAAQGSGGCFSERSLSAAAVLCYTHKTPNNEEIPIYVQAASEIHSSYETSGIFDSKPTPKLPVLSRSWCFQERLLATRVLHFAGEDLVWECRSKTTCECMGLDLWNRTKSIQRKFLDERHSYELWHRLLKLYMSRHITYPSDRLPAISGIAQQMQRAGLGDYIAGLWKENLFADLLWYSFPAQRAERCRGPSWSWACLSDPTELSYLVQTDHGLEDIYYPESALDHVNLRQRNSLDLDSVGNLFTTTLIKLPGLRSMGNIFAATLRQLEDSPAGEEPTGVVTSASLTISAPLITLSIGPPDPKDRLRRWKVCKYGEELEFRHDCDKDFVNYEKGNGNVVCIWIGTIWSNRDALPSPQLMVLRKSIGIGGRAATLGAYERVGATSRQIFTLEERQLSIVMAWFKEAKVTEVTIV
jgi:hypothetical protein